MANKTLAKKQGNKPIAPGQQLNQFQGNQLSNKAQFVNAKNKSQTGKLEADSNIQSSNSPQSMNVTQQSSATNVSADATNGQSADPNVPKIANFDKMSNRSRRKRETIDEVSMIKAEKEKVNEARGGRVRAS